MEISTAQIIEGLRAKAKRFSDMADELEGKTGNTLPQELSANGVRVRRRASQLHSPPQELPLGNVTLYQVQNYLRKKSGRIDDLARAFGVNRDVISAMVNDHTNGIVFTGRGWLKLAQ